MPPRKGQAKGGKGEGGSSPHKGGYKGEEKGDSKGSGKGKKGGGGKGGREDGGRRGGRKGGKADAGYDREEYAGADHGDWGGAPGGAAPAQRSQLNSSAPDFKPTSLAFGAVPMAGDMKQLWGWQGPGAQMLLNLPLWREYADEHGTPYYYNSKTGLTQWERPPELDPPKPPPPPPEGSGAAKRGTEGTGASRREGGRADVEREEPRRGGGDTGHGPRERDSGRGEGGRGEGGRGEGGRGEGGRGGDGRDREGGGGRGGGARGGKRRGGGKPSEDSAAKKGEGSEFGPPGCNLFVFHLPDDWTDEDLHEYFAPHGNVVSAKVMKELGTGRSRGFGFVSYEDRVSAATAIKKMQGYKILGKRLKVEFKKGEQEGGKVEGDDRGGEGSEDEEGGQSRRNFPDDERLIGYLRAISAKNVVQSLKGSESSRPQDEIPQDEGPELCEGETSG